MPKFILRVDDVGQALDQSQPDVGLKQFRKWWSRGNWNDIPIYLGVVPACLAGDGEALGFLNDICINDRRPRGAELCLHGWDHAKQTLTQDHVFKAMEAFPSARCVIPPYNNYDEETVKAVSLIADDPVLFGGFNREHHQYGNGPCLTRGVLHLSACRELYSHSYLVADFLKNVLDQKWPTVDYPLVITLHHRWDHGFLDGVRRLRDLVAEHVVTVDTAFDWLAKKEERDASRTTAPFGDAQEPNGGALLGE